MNPVFRDANASSGFGKHESATSYRWRASFTSQTKHGRKARWMLIALSP